MAMVSLLLYVEFGPNDHWEGAPHFSWKIDELFYRSL